MMSMHSSTHSSQMNTVGPAISLRTSCWLLPQNEQYSVFLESPPLLLILLINRFLSMPGDWRKAPVTRTKFMAARPSCQGIWLKRLAQHTHDDEYAAPN